MRNAPQQKDFQWIAHIVAVVSIATAGITTGSAAWDRAWRRPFVASAMTSLAHSLTPRPPLPAHCRGLAMIESTAIYTFVVSMILIFANPFWNHFLSQAGGK